MFSLFPRCNFPPSRDEQGKSIANCLVGDHGICLHAVQLLLNQGTFDPEAYLAAFHSETSAADLEKGCQFLNSELSEQASQLKELVIVLFRLKVLSAVY